METYINKENKHKIQAAYIDSTHKEGYIIVDDGIVAWEQKEMFDNIYEEEHPYTEPILNNNTKSMLDAFKASTKTNEESKQSERGIQITETEKNAWEYYKKYIDGYHENDFEIAVLPLMIYLSKHHTPMTKVIVENNKAELVEGLQSVVNNTFVVD